LRYVDKYGSIKISLMKHSFTLENDLTLIINLLAEMVEYKCITQSEMENIMQNIFKSNKDDMPVKLPSESVVKSIMNYSKAVNVLKTGDKRTFTLIVN
jgi:hypothetical protein